MYAVGTSLLYSRIGVCRVESIGAPPFQKGPAPPYYKLRAVFSTSNERIYVPVDTALLMRPLIDGGEASACLRRFGQMKPQIFRSRKIPDLTSHYQQLLSSCRLEDCLLLMKEVWAKERELAGQRKKLGQVDTRYLKIAERLVCGELAAVLHTTPEHMKRQLYAAITEEAAS